MKYIIVFALVSLCMTLCSSWWIRTKNWVTTARGCVTCYNIPMSGAKIYLMDKDTFFDDKMGSTRAGTDGCFTVTGKGRDGYTGKPEPYIRVEYEYSGTYGKMEVENIISQNKRGHTKARRYARSINFGRINFASIHCKAYVMFYKAMKDFRQRAHAHLPYTRLHIRTGVLIHGGTPYATTNTIRFPNNYSPSRVDYSTARHELAHTVRHSLDGSFGHFIGDAIRYWYARTHSCSTVSNYGYAFNEGWAEYWAGSCRGSYGSSLKNYRIEGNVAKALRRLKANCSSSDRYFVRLLRIYRGRIHSFSSFNSKHKTKFGCGL